MSDVLLNSDMYVANVSSISYLLVLFTMYFDICVESNLSHSPFMVFISFSDMKATHFSQQTVSFQCCQVGRQGFPFTLPPLPHVLLHMVTKIMKKLLSFQVIKEWDNINDVHF